MKKLVLVLMVALMLAPVVMASPATFYGRVCVGTYIDDADAKYLNHSDWNTAGATGDDDSDTIWDLLDARFGADFKVNDTVTAKVEIRSNLVSSNMTRHWYGAWKFSDIGTFVVGRTWAPTYQAITNSNLMDGAADVQGSLREDGLQLWFDIGGGQLKIAALDPSCAGGNNVGVDVSLPKLEVSYNHKFGPVDMNFFGGYQSYDYEDIQATGTTNYSIDSYVYGLTAAWEPKPFYVKGAFYLGQNLTEYGWGASFDHALAVTTTLTNSPATGGFTYNVHDVDYMGYVLLVGFIVNDRFEFEAGYTKIEMERDYSESGVAYSYEEGAAEYYVMATYKLADSVYMYPEINVLSCDDSEYTVNGVDQYAGTPGSAERGDRTRFGIYWRINF